MSTAMVAAMLPLQDGAAAAAKLVGSSAFDPALSLWHKWNAVYHHTLALCRKQQDLETQLVNTIGFPQAEVYRPNENVTFSWNIDAEEYSGDPAFAEDRVQAEADLAARQACWDAEDRRIGYSATKRKEQAAADQKQALVEVLTATPATTLSGVAGKLDTVLREGESSEDCMEFPWPQVRSSLADLVRIGQALQPGTFMPGADRKRSYPSQRRKVRLSLGDDASAWR